MLHSCEHGPQSGDSRGDAAQYPQEIAPLMQGGIARLPRDVHQCGRHLLLSSRGEVKQVGNRVQVPPEDRLLGGPCPISLPQLLLGDGVFAVGVCILVGAEHPVNLVK